MHRHFHLFDHLVSFENLITAFYKAAKGKRKQPNVAVFECNLEANILRLRHELLEGMYFPGSYRTFFIHEPKKRMISAAPFRDRVVHHAICNIIEPLFEPTFIFDTYANRKGKGTHAAINRCQKYLRRYRYVLKCDIQKYFPSIDHSILKELIVRRIGCKRTLELIFRVLDCSNLQELVLNYFSGDTLFSPVERRKGLPMGNLTSQFWANVYLNPLDHFACEMLLLPYIRYVDDFVVFSDNKAALWNALRQIRQFLTTHLRLQLHPYKCQIHLSHAGLTFLGQRIFADHRLIYSANVRRLRKRLRKQTAQFWRGNVTINELEASWNSWAGHARQADTRRLLGKLQREILTGGILFLRKPNGAWAVLGATPAALYD